MIPVIALVLGTLSARLAGFAGVEALDSWQVSVRAGLAQMLLLTGSAHWGRRRADLIAVGREALWDPNWPLHAAQALGVDPEFERWPVQYGWWLTRREALLRKQGFKR